MNNENFILINNTSTVAFTCNNEIAYISFYKFYSLEPFVRDKIYEFFVKNKFSNPVDCINNKNDYVYKIDDARKLYELLINKLEFKQF